MRRAGLTLAAVIPVGVAFVLGSLFGLWRLPYVTRTPYALDKRVVRWVLYADVGFGVLLILLSLVTGK